MTINTFSSVSAIADQYDGFLIDLWGVIHDGHDLYDGAKECLQALKAAGKKIVFLSNAPRRSFRAIERLEDMGVTADCYDHVLTSGEVTNHYVKSGKHGFGKNYLMIGPSRDDGLLDDTDYTRVYDASEADFAVVTGFSKDNSIIEDDIPTLEECLKHHVPMLCANPDIVVVRLDGTRSLCAGVVAEKYEEMGGNVTYFGKPFSKTYEEAFDLLSIHDKSRIAMIGDNLDTDIKGGQQAGIDTYLIVGGILGEELGVEHGNLPDISALEAVCKPKNIAPTAALPGFIWKEQQEKHQTAASQ